MWYDAVYMVDANAVVTPSGLLAKQSTHLINKLDFFSMKSFQISNNYLSKLIGVNAVVVLRQSKASVVTKHEIH